MKEKFISEFQKKYLDIFFLNFRSFTEFKMGGGRNGLIRRCNDSDNDMDSSEVNIAIQLLLRQEF